jgi:hypothetical protein
MDIQPSKPKLAKPAKRKGTPKELREESLKAYKEGSRAWTIEVDGVSVDALEEVWARFLKDAARCPTRKPLFFLTPVIRAYRGFSRLGSSGREELDSVADDLPPLTTGLVVIEEMGTSKGNAVSILAAQQVEPGMGVAIRYYLPGAYLNAKRAKTLANKQAHLEKRLVAKVTKASLKYASLVDSINGRLMDPAKGEMVKCSTCGSRYPRTALVPLLPAEGDLYSCVLCGNDLSTFKDKERLRAAADVLFATKETFRKESKSFGWLIRISN